MAEKKKYNPADNLPGPGPGRPKGSKDKLPKSLKNLVLDTIKKLEEEKKDLHSEAFKDPKWFYVNFVKPMLPKDIDVTGDVGLTVIIKKLGPEDLT